ncbi:hypothetical protein BK133_11015 [Paenibacillus sp. FSL H8-0548]|uniref:hypothetical protein n=1 Tax=Paenibacillus sp. FSL H8-0548 TaxID=1920422 RepID=UPI0009700C9D|nr:hypothetical protein [Paenibacillus sp. FSL H8-0548]OMF35234.1 hypothetical protein BK133_11015 [Paenibacillus sp. FSL H8-0548]
MKRMEPQKFQMIKDSMDRIAAIFHGDTVRGLVAHAEAIELELKISKEDEADTVRKFGQLAKDNDRLIDNVAQLASELNETREAKKVSLPREVAEVVESLVIDGRDIDYIVWHMTAYGDRHCYSDRVNIIREYAFENGWTLISALVNGYTVEEPPSTEDKIVTSLTQALEDMRVESPVPVERLAKVLTHAIREVLAEDRQEE